MAARAALDRAVAHLAGDPVMGRLIEAFGPPRLELPSSRGRARGQGEYFAALAESVLYQQLAGAAAAAIHRRFLEVLGGEATPEAVAAAGVDRLRTAGLSASKASTISNLARAVTVGELDLAEAARAPDDEVVASLTALPGIGPWTAQMFCIFTLGRLDVWPVTDYGVRKGYALAYGLEDLPTPRVLTAMGEPFRPYRSVAAWYLWRAVEQ
ncbi:MAG TPA: hypothetical protein VFH45_07685 [Acidimicrobiales bacterium]|nr:hypothetical protein [Acidimicrobiales bacterium]